MKKTKSERVLIIGGNSSIGILVENYLKNNKYEVHKTTRRKHEAGKNNLLVDLKCKQSFSSITEHYHHAIMLSGITSLEKCELEPEYTKRVNVDNTIALIKHLKALGARIIYLSTSLVFSDKNVVHAEEFPVDPRTIYGTQKAEVESYLLGNRGKDTIIRVSKAISAGNFLLNQWIKQLKNGECIRPFENKYLAPVYSDAVNFAIESAMSVWNKRIVHVTSSDFISYSELARKLGDQMKIDCKLIKPFLLEGVNEFMLEFARLKPSEEMLAAIGPIYSSDTIHKFYQDAK